jgi:hypothetical protein
MCYMAVTSRGAMSYEHAPGPGYPFVVKAEGCIEGEARYPADGLLDADALLWLIQFISRGAERVISRHYTFRRR